MGLQEAKTTCSNPEYCNTELSWRARARGVELCAKLRSGAMDVTLMRKCQVNDETARVHRVQCRVVEVIGWLNRDRAANFFQLLFSFFFFFFPFFIIFPICFLSCGSFFYTFFQKCFIVFLFLSSSFSPSFLPSFRVDDSK